MRASFLARAALTASLVAVIPEASAETITLTDGRVIEGTVLRSIGNTISIKYDGAGMLQVPVGDVQQVEIALQGGGVVSGRLIGWAKGSYRLSSDQSVVDVRVEDGIAVAIVERGGERRGVAAVSPSRSDGLTPRPFNVGFVFTGLADDGGRTFMQKKGLQTLAGNPAVGATSFLEIGSEDSDQVIGAVDQLVDAGANMIVVAGNESAAAVTEAAKRHEAVRFIYCGQSIATVDVVCGRIYEARYLSGIIAGGMTETNLIGYLAAKPTPDVIVGINAFALGAD